MDLLQNYSEITGIAVTTVNQTKIVAALERSKAVLEELLGYTLDDEERIMNHLPSESPIFAYRIFPYRKSDKYHHIDPATEIHTIKILKNGVVDETLADDEYSIINNRGLIKHFVIHKSLWTCGCENVCYHNNYELAVDATFVWEENKFPMDLMSVLAEMVTYYSNPKRDVRSETLGSHSYTRFENKAPETVEMNLKIIRRYAGPRGAAVKNVTF